MEIIKNNHKIIDAYCEEQNRFAYIKKKANVCVEANMKIEGRISEIINIFDVVFKNFYTERKPLDIFLLKDGYGDKKMKKWIIGKANLPEKSKWHYAELCLNNIGFTLLPSYGSKSYSIIEGGRNHSSTLYNLLALNDKVVIDALKPILKVEKLELMNKVLEGIKMLEYDNKFTKQQTFEYIGMKGEYNEQKKVKQLSGKYIQFEANGFQSLSFRMMQKPKNDYQDDNFNLMMLNFEESMIVEQISEEVIKNLDEYTLILQTKEKEIEQYFLDTKGKFIKELICLNLKGQKI